jgi:Zn-dependent peptidase ImmA (M78 family)
MYEEIAEVYQQEANVSNEMTYRAKCYINEVNNRMWHSKQSKS